MFRDVASDPDNEKTGSQKLCKERKEKGESKDERNGKKGKKKIKRRKTAFQPLVIMF